ncbi:hypothetical protein E4T56_gene6963 [Termitomyces sp. T112]|nr:hypothetical protein E4T56_gene6963 [Termitomyces sp. T112]
MRNSLRLVVPPVPVLFFSPRRPRQKETCHVSDKGFVPIYGSSIKGRFRVGGGRRFTYSSLRGEPLGRHAHYSVRSEVSRSRYAAVCIINSSRSLTILFSSCWPCILPAIMRHSNDATPGDHLQVAFAALASVSVLSIPRAQQIQVRHLGYPLNAPHVEFHQRTSPKSLNFITRLTYYLFETQVD